ncbi:hypothetical protein LTR16_000518, partial [Cryomyces antarcticus]
MQNAATEANDPESPQQPNLLLTPETERTVDTWQQSGSFPFPELPVFPQPQWHEYSKIDLRLIHHVSSISSSMSHTGSDRLTTWTEHMPKRGWASLMTGTKTIVAHMQPWRHESMFAGHIIEQGLTAPQAFPNATGYPVTQESRREQQATLQHIAHSLQRIRSYLAGI